MADSKQYITQEQENGTVMISEEVISSIVASAAQEVEGVAGLGNKSSVEVIAKKNWSKGMRITIAENNDISIECNIVVTYGHTVVTVAKAVQDGILSAVESMTGVKPSSVNVSVCGIIRQ